MADLKNNIPVPLAELEIYGKHRSAIKEQSLDPIAPVEKTTVELEDKELKKGEYQPFKELCRECMVREIVGCVSCGIYQYAENKKLYDIKVRRITKDGTNVE